MQRTNLKVIIEERDALVFDPHKTQKTYITFVKDRIKELIKVYLGGCGLL